MDHYVCLHQHVILAFITLPFILSCALISVSIFKFCQTVALNLSEFMADQVGLNNLMVGQFKIHLS